MKNRKRNYLIYFLALLIPLGAMLLQMALRRCFPFGNYTILVGDANVQYVNFFKEYFDVIKEGKGLFFNWDAGMGYDFYSNFWYYLANPFNIIILLLGKGNVEISATIVLVLQVCCCSLCANYYFRHSKVNKLNHGKINDTICLLLCTAYAISSYMIAYNHNMMWMSSLILAPILMLGVEHLVDRNDGRLYGVTLFLTLVTNFYFAWFVCILGLIWFVDQKKESLAKGLKSFVKFVAISVVSAMCSAVVLVPCYLRVAGRKDTQNSWSKHSLSEFGSIGDFFQGFFFGHKIDSVKVDSIFVNNNYIGIFAIVLALLYFFTNNKNLGQRLKRVAEVVFVAFAMNWAPLNWVFHGFSFTHGSGNRFGFILVLLLLICAMECLGNIEKINKFSLIFTIVLILIFVTLGLVFCTDVEGIVSYLVTFLLTAYFLICIVLYLKKSIKKNSLILNLAIIGFIELYGNVFFGGTGVYSFYLDRENKVSSYENIYQNLDVEPGERKTAYMMDKIGFYNSDTDIFSSTCNTDLLNMFKNLGLTYGANGGLYEYRGVTPLTATLYNVRYVITDKDFLFGGYEKLEEKNDYKIYENQYLSGFGFMLSEKALNWDMTENNPFEVQNNFTRDVLGEGDIFTKQEFKDAEYNGGSALVMSVNGSAINYINYALDGSNAYVDTYFVCPKDMDLYLYAHDETQSMVSVYVGTDKVYETTATSDGDMLHIGKVLKGQEVMAFVTNNCKAGEEGTTYMDFYSFDEQVMEKCKNIILKEQFKITNLHNSKLTGTIENSEGGLLYLSVPYYKGMKAYVNGKKTSISVIGGAMVGIELQAGVNEIKLTYIPYGFETGLIISMLGIIICIFWIIVLKKKKKK